jgi:hypothetical protein
LFSAPYKNKVMTGTPEGLVLGSRQKAPQRRIVAERASLQSGIDLLNHGQAETAAEFDALLSSILNRAFAGAL